jgi:2-amino-4-hydroxy-6-hydroxymethyldihydropteridine diphosphokinase
MIIIALGSNLSGPWGAPRDMVQGALNELAQHGIQILRESTLIETDPFGVTDQPAFVNAAALIETDHSAGDLMKIMHDVEARAGRKRVVRWGPRTLDLDLIDYRGVVSPFDQPLKLPHPGIAERDFVLLPISEIAPEWKHPVTRLTASDMLRVLKSR